MMKLNQNYKDLYEQHKETDFNITNNIINSNIVNNTNNINH